MAAQFDQLIAQAVADRVIPGVVLAAEDKTGNLRYEKVIGASSVEPGQEQAAALQRDSVFTLMSMSKLVTAVAVLQAVDQGLADLDADVAPVLPELAAQPVLLRFEGDDHGGDGHPVFADRARPITLRHLLTHSSGVGYDFMTPLLVEYRGWLKDHGGPDRRPPKIAADPPSVEARFDMPLVFQPGEGWTYGAGLDWAGRYLERVWGKKHGQAAVRFEDILIRGVLAPLGLPAGSLTFHPDQYPDVRARMWKTLPVRTTVDGPVTHGAPIFKAPTRAALGGQGLYGDAPSYLAVLVSLLRDDGKLLPPATADLLFTPQLGTDAARKALLDAIAEPEWIVGVVPDTGGEYDWSLSGLLVTGPSHPYRKPGAALWGGAINLAWIVDRKAGLAAVFFTNLQPPGDGQTRELMRAWETFIYPQVPKL